MTDEPRSRVTGRSRFAVLLLLLGVVAAFVPGLAAGNGFRPCGWISKGTFLIPKPPVSGSGAYRITGDGARVGGDARAIVVTGNAQITYTGVGSGRARLCDLVAYEPGWTAAAAALIAMAPLYLWWRRGGLAFARVAGIAACIAAAAAVCVFVLVPRTLFEESIGGIWWTMPLGALLMAAAFLVAPAPVRSRDD